MHGGKAKYLQKLIDTGLPVPKFIVIEGVRSADTEFINNEIKKLSGDLFAVRSSANIEDGANKSYAGAFDTELNVSSDKIMDAVDVVMKSAEREEGAIMNVIIQEMVEPIFAGVAFSHVYNESGARCAKISFVAGLGEGLVSGKKDSFDLLFNWIRDDKINPNSFTSKGPGKLPPINWVYDLLSQIEKICADICPRADIEFCVDAADKVWITQARPITADIITQKPSDNFATLASGIGAGNVSFIPCFNRTDAEIKEDVKNFPAGNILVGQYVDTRFNAALERASGVVVGTGSVMCHGAIVARERGVPCVTTAGIFQFARDAKHIEINTGAGEIVIDGRKFVARKTDISYSLKDLADWERGTEFYIDGRLFIYENNAAGLYMSYRNMKDMSWETVTRADLYLRRKFGIAPTHSGTSKGFMVKMARIRRALPNYQKMLSRAREIAELRNPDVAIKFYDEMTEIAQRFNAGYEAADIVRKVYIREEIKGMDEIRNTIFPDMATAALYRYLYPYMQKADISFEDILKPDFMHENIGLMDANKWILTIQDLRNNAWGKWIELGLADTERFNTMVDMMAKHYGEVYEKGTPEYYSASIRFFIRMYNNEFLTLPEFVSVKPDLLLLDTLSEDFATNF